MIIKINVMDAFPLVRFARKDSVVSLLTKQADDTNIHAIKKKKKLNKEKKLRSFQELQDHQLWFCAVAGSLARHIDW